jgi:NLE (NUC135) domain
MEIEVTFKTNLGEAWNVEGSYFINTNSTREELQELVLHVIEKNCLLVFTLNGVALTGTLHE